MYVVSGWWRGEGRGLSVHGEWVVEEGGEGSGLTVRCLPFRMTAVALYWVPREQEEIFKVGSHTEMETN